MSFTWEFFVLNNLTTQVQIQLVQNMKCILCHPIVQASNNSNSMMQSKKGIISYNLTHDIKSMKQHVINEHDTTLNWYKEQKKTTPHSIIDFMSSQILYKFNDLGQKRFIE